MENRQVALIGYSGHAYVVNDILVSSDREVVAYLEQEERVDNPLGLEYLGHEQDPGAQQKLEKMDYIIAIGDNSTRKRIYDSLKASGCSAPINGIHATAIISNTALLENQSGIVIGPNVILNAFCKIGTGVICNSGCIIEHECQIGSFSHIAPGAVLCGGVTIGSGTFIGANSVIKQGISVGNDVTIGAGTVVISDILDYKKVVGNPQRYI